MRLLRINDRNVDIDESTAIGIDIACYHLKEPVFRKLSTSNSFTIPMTANNASIFDIVGGIQSNGTNLYSTNKVEYWVNNEKLVSGAKVKVDSISDRINLTIVSAADFFEGLKSLKGKALFDLIHGFLAYKNDSQHYPTAFPDVYHGTLQSLLETIALNTEGIVLPMTYGPLYEKQFENIAGSIIDDPPYYAYLESEFGGIKIRYPRIVEDESGNTVFSPTLPPSTGGHFYFYAYSFVEMLQWYIGTDIGFGSTIPGNLWNDGNFKKIAFPIPTITLRNDPPNSIDSLYYFESLPFNNDGTFSYIDPLNNVSMDNISAYEILMALVRMFSATIDKTDTGYVFRRLDQIEEYGKVEDWSEKVDYDAEKRMVPYVDNYAQKSYVKYDKFEDGLSEFIGAKTVACNNHNLPVEVDLFKVKNYVPKLAIFKDNVCPLMTKANAMTYISFLFIDGLNTRPTKIEMFSHPGGFSANVKKFEALVTLPIASVYSMEGEFAFLDKVNQDPKEYTRGLWLTSNDIRKIDNFTLIYIKSLGGCFYLNKISGFNPDKSKTSTTCELIKVNDKTPLNIAYVDAYLDGQGNQFTDGQGNPFI